jgi:hypothetical protein
VKVWILTLDVDLGVSIEGVYDNPDEPNRIAAERMEHDRTTWGGDDGNTYSRPGAWEVQEHEVAAGVTPCGKPEVVTAKLVNPEGAHPADPHGPWPPNRTVVAEDRRNAGVAVRLPGCTSPDCGCVGPYCEAPVQRPRGVGVDRHQTFSQNTPTEPRKA